jgi:hypothetical protein
VIRRGKVQPPRSFCNCVPGTLTLHTIVQSRNEPAVWIDKLSAAAEDCLRIGSVRVGPALFGTGTARQNFQFLGPTSTAHVDMIAVEGIAFGLDGD